MNAHLASHIQSVSAVSSKPYSIVVWNILKNLQIEAVFCRFSISRLKIFNIHIEVPHVKATRYFKFTFLLFTLARAFKITIIIFDHFHSN